jgi:hypothetical protein
MPSNDEKDSAPAIPYSTPVNEALDYFLRTYDDVARGVDEFKEWEAARDEWRQKYVVELSGALKNINPTWDTAVVPTPTAYVDYASVPYITQSTCTNGKSVTINPAPTLGTCKEVVKAPAASTLPAPLFESVTAYLDALYARKNKAYGNSFGRSVERYGKIAALTRMSDKFNRLETLILNEKMDTGDESLYDTLLDLSTYCIMTYMELRKEELNK